MNDLNDKVIRYRASRNSKERNKLYQEIRGHYLPRALAVKASFPPRYHDDVISSYDWLLLRCIEKWDSNKGVLFTTYWYIYTGLKLKSEVQEKYILKDQREMDAKNNPFLVDNLSVDENQSSIFQELASKAVSQIAQEKDNIILSALKDFLGAEELNMADLRERGACFQPPSGDPQTFTFDDKPFIEFYKPSFETVKENGKEFSLKQEMKYRRLF